MYSEGSISSGGKTQPSFFSYWTLRPGLWREVLSRSFSLGLSVAMKKTVTEQGDPQSNVKVG